MNRLWIGWLLLAPGLVAGQTDNAGGLDSKATVDDEAHVRVASRRDTWFEGMIQYRVSTRYTGTHAAEYQRDSSQYPTHQRTEVHATGWRMAAWGPLYQSTAIRTADNQQYVLDSLRQVAWQAPGWADSLTIVPQAQREIILGHPTRLYHVVTKPKRGVKPRIYQQIWVADSLRPASKVALYPGVLGLPLRIVTQDNVPFRNQLGTTVTVTVEAIGVVPQSLPADRFQLPPGYVVKPWDQVALFGGMGGDRNLTPNGMPQNGGNPPGNPR